MVAPSKPGRYVSYWRLAQPNGERFGQRVWVDIVVEPKNSKSVDEQMQDCNSSPQEESQLFDTVEQKVNELLSLGFCDSGLIRALLEVNENNLEKTKEDLLNLTKPKSD